MHIYLFIVKNRSFIVGVVFLCIFLWEQVFPQREFLNLFQHNLINFGIGSANMIVSFAGGYYFSKYLDLTSHTFIGIINYFPASLKIIGGFLIADLLMYWWHRFNHIIPFLWRFHVLHHRDEMMNSTTSVRFHLMELILSFIFRAVLYPVFGIDSLILLLYSTIHFVMIIFHHSNISIRKDIDKVLRLIITSPNMHRIHHSNKWIETNSNYTSIFSIWDFLFGSYVEKESKEIVFGIPRS